MNIVKNPNDEQLRRLTERPEVNLSELQSVVSEVLRRVKAEGDRAVIDFEEKFDHVRLSSLAVSEAEILEAEELISPELRSAISLAHENIRRFHESQLFDGHPVETALGVTCWQKSVAIEKVGLYIPGGTAPLFSTVLMLATPAR
ncbi:MAG: histidinol dehydrogenase, partial [Prevotella sp.]|nr:histidinol dehydrogenase [Prevotella sp.]